LVAAIYDPKVISCIIIFDAHQLQQLQYTNVTDRRGL